MSPQPWLSASPFFGQRWWGPGMGLRRCSGREGGPAPPVTHLSGLLGGGQSGPV